MENDSAAPPSDPTPFTVTPFAPAGAVAPHAPPQPIGGMKQPDHYPLWPGQPYRVAPQCAPPHRPVAPRRRVRPFRPVEIVAALGVVLLADVAMWSGSATTVAIGGAGLAVLFAGLATVLFMTFVRGRSGWWRRGSVRLGLVAGLLALVIVRCALAPTLGTAAAGLGLVTAFGIALRVRRAFVPDVVRSAVGGVFSLWPRIRAAAAGARALGSRTRIGRVSVLPIVVPAGLVVVFLGVFALANPLVAHGLDAAWSALARFVVLPSVGRLFFWSFALVAGIALVRPACRLARGGEIARPSGEASPTSLSVARNALVGLNVLFLAYNALDATYLWSGSPPAGMNTQEYAHQGAFWLTLALLMLTAVIGVMFRGPLAHDARARTSRWLAHAWMGQGLVLALGTYRRIAIHIAQSGLSDLRIVGILGTSLVVCGMVLVALQLRQGKTFTWLLRRQLDALALTAVLYVVAPTHLVSAQVNVARVLGGEYRPLLHAFRQSHETESAASLLPLLEHPDARVRQGVAALLEDERQRLRTMASDRREWRQRDLATGRSLAALDGASERIELALADANADEARRVLLEISRAANQDRSLEELLAIPAARGRSAVTY